MLIEIAIGNKCSIQKTNLSDDGRMSNNKAWFILGDKQQIFL